jgi:calcineurin-like phosphoesterase family protein
MKIILEKQQKIYFSSDSHYSHRNICSATSNWEAGRGTRKFNSLNEMNDRLVYELNAALGPDDILVHLGDWSFGGIESVAEFRNRINCKTIHLFLGNHDHHIANNKEGVAELFTTVNKLETLDLRVPQGKETKKYTFECCHFPIASWDGLGKGYQHLHGHVHLPGHLKIHQGRAMDVGVDGNNYKPYSLNDILKALEGRPKMHLSLPKDHHTDEE